MGELAEKTKSVMKKVEGCKKIDRNVARWRMRQRGMTQINKKKSGPSYFAEHWREFVY